MDYIKLMVEEIHSTTVATIGADGHPQTRIIDMMYYDEKGIYFLTAKGKSFYAQLMEQQYVAISATKRKTAISLRGKVKNIGKKNLDISNPSNIVREAIIIGGGSSAWNGYHVERGCNGCNLCLSVCPQKCIDVSSVPVVINQKHCLHCGRCAEICPGHCIKKRG